LTLLINNSYSEHEEYVLSVISHMKPAITVQNSRTTTYHHRSTLLYKLWLMKHKKLLQKCVPFLVTNYITTLGQERFFFFFSNG